MVVLLFSQHGRHNASQSVKLNDALNALGNKRAYVAALNSADLDEAALQSLAKTQDRYFKADDVAGLEQMFVDIQSDIQSLSNQYLFSLLPKPDKRSCPL